jgi:hypothetical protein
MPVISAGMCRLRLIVSFAYSLTDVCVVTSPRSRMMSSTTTTILRTQIITESVAKMTRKMETKTT